ncbi:MAG: hypothetical protein KKB34_05125 [Bacteroidetes bacterium]|nr:hypothetical protein [Bacteroidota bacterium]
MTTNHSAPRYKAFFEELGPIKSFIIVKEVDGLKYFKWLSIDDLKILLGV